MAEDEQRDEIDEVIQGSYRSKNNFSIVEKTRGIRCVVIDKYVESSSTYFFSIAPFCSNPHTANPNLHQHKLKLSRGLFSDSIKKDNKLKRRQ